MKFWSIFSKKPKFSLGAPAPRDISYRKAIFAIKRRFLQIYNNYAKKCFLWLYIWGAEKILAPLNFQNLSAPLAKRNVFCADTT